MKGRMLRKPAFAEDKPERPPVIRLGERVKKRARKGEAPPDIPAKARKQRRRDRAELQKVNRRQRRG